jgi:hypothetical protein
LQGAARAVVTIAGASRGHRGIPPKVNGVFDLVPRELHNGRALFRKRDDEDVWLMCTSDGEWMVSDTASKELNDSCGFACAPHSDCDNLPPLSGWCVSDGKGYVPDDGITVTHSGALKVSIVMVVDVAVLRA